MVRSNTKQKSYETYEMSLGLSFELSAWRKKPKEMDDKTQRILTTNQTGMRIKCIILICILSSNSTKKCLRHGIYSLLSELLADCVDVMLTVRPFSEQSLFDWMAVITCLSFKVSYSENVTKMSHISQQNQQEKNKIK